MAHQSSNPQPLFRNNFSLRTYNKELRFLLEDTKYVYWEMNGDNNLQINFGIEENTDNLAAIAKATKLYSRNSGIDIEVVREGFNGEELFTMRFTNLRFRSLRGNLDYMNTEMAVSKLTFQCDELVVEPAQQ